jgi:hypothetical protein
MRIVPELDHKICRQIRDARAIGPLVSVVDLQELLEGKSNRTFPANTSPSLPRRLNIKLSLTPTAPSSKTECSSRAKITA